MFVFECNWAAQILACSAEGFISLLLETLPQIASLELFVMIYYD
jgi:hypothetical protein